MTARTPLFALLAVALLLAVGAGSASAHKTAYTPDGKVRIVWGFLNEPAVTYTKTGLDLQLRDNVTGGPIEGAHTTLNASLVLGSQSHPFTLAPQFGADKRGHYTDVVTLTRPGLYSLRLVGTLNGTAVDLTIPGQHEIADVGETYFPDAEGPAALAEQVKALQTEVAALKAKAQTQSQTPATVTPQDGNGRGVPGLGAVSALAVLGVAALLLVRRRS